MKFGYCGINYRKANQDIRDRFSFTDSKKEKLFSLLEEKGIYQSMILSTCNRSEVFFFYESDSQINTVADCFKRLFLDKTDEDIEKTGKLDNYLEQDFEKYAMEHLFKVAAGLESMVLGEDQILGQVKEAYEFSRTMGYSKKELNRVVTDAIACARNIKALYKISEIPLSVGYVGVKELNLKCSIKGKKVLIIGSGQTAGLALKYIVEFNPSDIFICNRTREKALDMIREYEKDKNINIQMKNFDDRYDLMRECDIVVSATSSPHLVIDSKKCQIERRMWMLDLASPRDIDADLKNNELCTLIDLDILGEMVEQNRKERQELSEKSAGIIDKAVDETIAWLNLTAVDGTIESLQKRCEDIVNDSFAYINRKLSLSEHEQMVIERTLKASLKRLLREPIVELKSIETKEEQELFKSTVKRLFHI